MIIGFVLRLLLLLVSSSHSTDGIAFLSTAYYIDHPEEWSNIPPRILMPLFPFLIYVFSFLTRGDLSLAARWVNLVAGMAMILSSFFMAKRLFNVKTGLLTSFFVALAPVLIRQSTTERSDLLFTLFSLLLAYYFRVIPWEKADFKKSLFFGLILGISQLVRPNAICFLVLFLFYWIRLLFLKRLTFKAMVTRILFPVCLVCIIFALIPLTYLKIIHAPPINYISNAYLDGLYMAQGTREHDWFQLNDDATGFKSDELKRNFKLTDFLNWRSISTKYSYAWVYVQQYTTQSSYEYFQGWFVLIIIMLLFLIYLRKEITGWKTVGYLLSFSIPFIFIVPFIQIQGTYLIPLHPFFLLILSWVIIEFSQVKQFVIYGKIIACIIVIAIACTNIYAYHVQKNDEIRSYDGYRAIGLHLRDIGKPGELILARNNTIYFYAKMRGYPMPAAQLDQTIKFCRYKGIKYMVFGPDERYVRGLWESEILQRIKDGDTTFELIYKDFRGGIYRVFKINPDIHADTTTTQSDSQDIKN
jgi:4-amino-4-deoxy-L-arabinose transferase-like glycosyltransferase